MPLQSWISADFGADDDFDAPSPSSRLGRQRSSDAFPRGFKRPREEGGKTGTEEAVWSLRLTPQTASQLAVHPKKVQEVRTWMERASQVGTSRNTVVVILCSHFSSFYPENFQYIKNIPLTLKKEPEL